MVKITKGNILDQNTQALVNTVNCVGVMGRGIALAFRDAFPENFRQYKKACEKNEVQPGKMFVHLTGDIFENRYIINFPTKRHWKDKSRLVDIIAGLDEMVRVVKNLDIQSIAIPPLGCGLGGLDWNDVKPLITKAMESLPEVNAVIIEPDNNFEVKRTGKERMGVKESKLTGGRAGMIALMGRYLEALMDTGISLLELHKLTYFLQENGEPLRLRFKKADYGPYAENLRHVLDVMNNVFIRGFDDRKDDPEKVIDILGDSYGEAQDFLENDPATKSRIENVADLISGFETPFGLELLSTVHWVASKESADTVEKVISKTHAWNDRKKMFNTDQIILARDRLMAKNWV